MSDILTEIRAKMQEYVQESIAEAEARGKAASIADLKSRTLRLQNDGKTAEEILRELGLSN